MHQIIYSIRQIPSAQLPTVRDFETGEQRDATAAELLNMGMQHLRDDFYSCAEQINSDDDRDIVEIGGRLERRWQHVGAAPAGVAITAGRLHERHARLPAEVKPHILRAKIIRGTDTSARAVVATSLAEQAAAIAEFVGPVEPEGTPLVDLESPQAILDEARRLEAIPDNGIERATVVMADVAVADDIVEQDGLIPHAWAGER